MTWMLTRHGREHHLSGCEILMNTIDIADVAHALAQINRFTGHCTRPYSVAEHSLLVAELARRDRKSALIQLACLLHDAHEAYTGDMATPSKNAVGLAWGAFETRHADIVRRSLGLITAFQVHRALIHHYDLVALATERRQLTTWSDSHHRPWPILDAPGREVEPSSINLNALERVNRPWSAWRDQFLERYFALTAAVQTSEPTEISP